MAKDTTLTKTENKDCFIIMPIGDTDGYDPGHFTHVYDDIIKPAVLKTEFSPRRADEVKETNFIHLDILTKLIEAPMAICDLSSRNPNVLFELGIRQAFDKPVVLIQEKGTPKIFDIGPLRYLEYSRDMKYHDVLKTQAELTEAIVATKAAVGGHGNINSIVRLMALSSPATIPQLEGNNKETLALDIIQSQMSDLRHMLEMTMMDGKRGNRKGSIVAIEYERIVNKLDKLSPLKNLKGLAKDNTEKEYHKLMMDAEKLMMHCDHHDGDHRMMRYLMDKVHDQMRDN